MLVVGRIEPPSIKWSSDDFRGVLMKVEDEALRVLNEKRIVSVVDINNAGVEGLIPAGDDDWLVWSAGKGQPVLAEAGVIGASDQFKSVIELD